MQALWLLCTFLTFILANMLIFNNTTICNSNISKSCFTTMRSLNTNPLSYQSFIKQLQLCIDGERIERQLCYIINSYQKSNINLMKDGNSTFILSNDSMKDNCLPNNMIDGICFKNGQVLPDSYFEAKSYSSQIKINFKDFIWADLLKAAEAECRLHNNVSACQMIANFCVLDHYILTANNRENFWCSVYADLSSAQLNRLIANRDNTLTVPWLYYQDPRSVQLYQNNLGVTRQSSQGMKWSFKFFAHSLFGTALGLYDPSILLQCPMPDAYSTNAFTFGTPANIECDLDGASLWNFTQASILFFDPYLEGTRTVDGVEISNGQLYPIPVYLYKSPKRQSSTNLPSSTARGLKNSFISSATNVMSDNTFYRRFFVRENVKSAENQFITIAPRNKPSLGSSDPSLTPRNYAEQRFSRNDTDATKTGDENLIEGAQISIPAIIQYARNIHILVNTKETFPGTIDIPLTMIMVEYEELQATDFFPNFSDANLASPLWPQPRIKPRTSLSITYVSNFDRSSRSLRIVLGTLGILCLARALFTVWRWCRRSGKEVLDIELLVKFFIYLSAPFGLLLYFTVLILALALTLSFKFNKSYVPVTLPTKAQERPFALCLAIAMGLLAVHLLYNISRQASYELFFVDWEPEKEFTPTQDNTENDTPKEQDKGGNHPKKGGKKHKKRRKETPLIVTHSGQTQAETSILTSALKPNPYDFNYPTSTTMMGFQQAAPVPFANYYGGGYYDNYGSQPYDLTQYNQGAPALDNAIYGAKSPMQDYNNPQPGSANRILTCVRYWCELQTFREIPNRIIVFTGLLIVWVIDWSKVTIYPPSVMTYANGQLRLETLPESGILRFALTNSIFCALAFAVWIFKRIVITRMRRHPVNTFVNLCKNNNVALFTLKERKYAIYVHGKNPYGRADVTLTELVTRIRNEKQSNYGMNPMLPNEILKPGICYEICLNPAASNAINQMTLALQQPLINQFITDMDTGFACSSSMSSPPYMFSQFSWSGSMSEKKIASYQYLSRFLMGFLSCAFPGLPYTILSKTPLERLFGFESVEPLHVSYLFPNETSRVLRQLLLVKHQVPLFAFEVILFSILDYATSGNFTYLALFVVCLLDKIVCKCLHYACRKNIAAKSLISIELLSP